MKRHLLAGLVLLTIIGCGSKDANSTRAGGREATASSGAPDGESPSEEPEHVPSLWAHAAVDEDGAAQIVEVIDYDFGTAERHGIIRSVPGLSPSAEVTASSDDAPDDVRVEPSNGDAEPGAVIRIGDPDEVVSGRHRYRLQFPLSQVTVSGGADWNAVGTGWEVPIESVELHLTAEFEFSSLYCSRRLLGLRNDCDRIEQLEPGHLVATIDDLEPGEGVWIHAQYDQPLPTAPSPPRPPS